ncbi:MAG: hypothetical protein WDA13_02535 [Candidatus Shapirobacteria bacterium]
MSKKNIYLIGVGIIIIILGIFFLTKNNKSSIDQVVFKDTLSISKEYTLLRYRTENVLEKAREYQDYDKWNQEMTAVIEGWGKLENEVLELEKNADKLANEKTAFNLTKDIYAYDSVEVQKVINSAPMGKQVRTLAKHLGVDVKMAQLILNQTQDQVTREAYGEEGDVFETCEQNSMRIKNGAKVTVFVGTVVLSGGVAGIVSSGTIATAGTVVAGADLALEITEDEARIALGDKNKVTEMAGSIRSVTEPASGILAIANIPGNLTKAIDKFSAVNFTADQVRSSIQDKKIIGINIKTDDKGEIKANVSGLTKEELIKWREENNVMESSQTIEEIIKQIEEENKESADIKESGEAKEEENNNETTDQDKQLQEEKPLEAEQAQETNTNSITGQSMAGTYSGSAILQHVEEDIEADDNLAVTLQLNDSGTGTANVYGYDGVAQYAGNNVSFSVSMKEGGYVVNAVFTGKATRNGNQTVISGNIRTVMMGVTVATYSWSGQN